MNVHNQRQVYGETLLALARENPDIVACDADLSKSTMSCLFAEAFPDRFFEMGIAEANMVSFAVFVSGRPYDQIRVSVCLGKLNVKIIGSSAGLSDFGDGSTHQSVDDIALMRSLPNMTVLAPVDGIEVERMTRLIADFKGPVYMRVNRGDLPDLFPEQESFEIGRPYVIREGTDAVVFAHGVMVSKALEAAQVLEKEGLSIRVVNVSTLKPVDEGRLRSLAADMKAVVTAEEHSLIGGLADVVAYALRGGGAPIQSIGINDCFGQSAHSYEELLQHYGLTAENVYKTMKETLK